MSYSDFDTIRALVSVMRWENVVYSCTASSEYTHYTCEMAINGILNHIPWLAKASDTQLWINITFSCPRQLTLGRVANPFAKYFCFKLVQLEFNNDIYKQV